MKYLSILILSFSLLTSYATAKEKKAPQDEETQSIEELLKEIKNNTSNRRVAINRLKIRLRSVNTDIRRKVMLDLQRSLGGHRVKTTLSSTSNYTQTHTGVAQQQRPVKQIHTSVSSTNPTSVPTQTSVPSTSPAVAPTHTSVPNSIPTSVPTHTSVPNSIPTSVPTHTSVPNSIPTSVPTQTSVPSSIPTSVPTQTSVPSSIPNQQTNRPMHKL